MQQTLLNKQLVLIGGGHANVQVLRKLCMNEYKGLNVILISESYGAIYSGMTPGYIEGLYSLDEITIDLQRLCFNAGATFIKDKVISLDEENQIIHLSNNPTISFDLLSINSGSISNSHTIHLDDDSKVIYVKPISSLVSKISVIDEIIEKSPRKKISIVGGGVAAFELSFALHKRYNGKISLDIISKQHLDEKNLNISSINKIKKIAKKIGINLICNQVVAINESKIKIDNEGIIDSDLILLSTGAALSNWLEKSKLEKVGNFVGINNQLQSLNYKNIFVSGDVASIKNIKRPKSGVMAVRQGEILKDNLFLFLQNKTLKKFKPQKNWLYLIGSHKNSAVLNYFNSSFEGNWCWLLKKKIDSRFMEKFIFSEKIEMKKKVHKINLVEDDITKMHCQGCGSKVSKNTLLKFLDNQKTNKELSDATEIIFEQNNILQTIDHIKLFKSLNPYDFGVISYLHSQNDILAAGGSVHSLSISVGIPFSENLVESFYLKYFMSGIQNEVFKNRVFIASGHSYQTEEPAITINMNGRIEKEIGKSLANEGDLIYLSKPLGVGYLLSAYYKNSKLLSNLDFENLLKYLKKSNSSAAETAFNFDSKAITDISGFGLASHLADICENSNLSAEILLKDHILINHNFEILDLFESSGYKNNYLSSIHQVDIDIKHPFFKILFDPQTNGPLLFTINESKKNKFEKSFLENLGFEPLYLGKFKPRKEKLIIVPSN